jgi:hypothetical protein
VEPDFEVEDLETLDRLMSELVQEQKMRSLEIQNRVIVN